METRSRRIVFFLFWMHLYCAQIFFKTNAQNCTGNGLKECACNFIKACVWNDVKKKFETFNGSSEASLKPFLPDGLHVLAKNPKKVAMICEPGSIGIFYDCENRIPIAATIVITPEQYDNKRYRRKGNFRLSSNILKVLQQKKEDYQNASKRIPCYKGQQSTTLFIETKWYEYLEKETVQPPKTCVGVRKTSPIDKGHLIAAHYGLGNVNNNRILETFVHTNVVPQFRTLNRGEWRKFEGKLIQWARDNCNEAPIHIIVGSVPSTFGTNNKRFFGKPGFSEYLSDYEGYRINVPAYVWTAACCMPGKFTNSTFYLAENAPGMPLVVAKPFSQLFSSIRDYPLGSAGDIKLFPKWPDCHDDGNFVKIL